MSEATIYHNPCCSNSRAALALLEEHGYAPRVIEYLTAPLKADAIRGLLQHYDGEACDFIRFKESQAATQGLSPESSVEAIIAAIVAEPILLQRPVVVIQDRVIIARPPDVLLPFLARTDSFQGTGS